MKKIILPILLLLACFTHAQEASVTAGNEATGLGGSASYSIGQVVYTTNTGTTGAMAQGVQQPYEISTLGTNAFPEISLKCSAYPNPTSDILTIAIENHELTHFSYQLIDVTGKIIQTNKITQDQTIIDMRNSIAATYFIAISENNKVLKTFKIIKN
jgi:hypothetical protein